MDLTFRPIQQWPQPLTKSRKSGQFRASLGQAECTALRGGKPIALWLNPTTVLRVSARLNSHLLSRNSH